MDGAVETAPGAPIAFWTSDQQPTQLLQGLPLATVALDLSARVRYWNPAAERLFGWTSADVLAAPYPWETNEHSDPGFPDRFQRALSGGACTAIQTEILARGGRLLHLSITSSPLRDPTGAIVGVLETFTEESPRERRLRLLFEKHPQAFLLTDDQGTFVEANEAATQLVGLPPAKLIGSRVADLQAPPDEEAGAGLPHLRLQRPDGVVRLVEHSGIRLGPDLHLSIYREVAAQQPEAERAAWLAERQRLLEALTNRVPGLLFAVDLEQNRLIFANEELLRFHEAPSLEALGDRLPQLAERVHPDDRALLQAAFEVSRGSLPTGNGIDRECRIRNAAGQYRWFQIRAGVYTGLHGDHRVLIGIALDVTEGRRTQDFLRASEQLTATLFARAPIGIHIFDRTGISRGYNEAHRRQLGAPSLDYGVGEFNFLEDPFPRSRGLDEYFRRCLQGESVVLRDWPVDLAASSNQWQTDRKMIWLDQHLFPIHDDQGQVQYVVYFAVDVTWRREAEEQRRLAEQRILETQKLESLGVLAGGVAHDFNNLLTAIIGYAALAQMDLHNPPALKRSLGEIEAASQRAADLCRQLLAYAGKGRFVVEVFDLNRLLEDSRTFLRGSLPSTIDLRVHLAEEPLLIRADAVQVRQLVMNLLHNASEALGDVGGPIDIAVGCGTLDEAKLMQLRQRYEMQPGEYVFIEVRDTGCGIDPENLPRIFEPFYTTKFLGRGLGLSAVQGIVRSHQGGLEVWSTPKLGSTFRIWLPLAAAPAEPATRTQSAPLPIWKDGGTVLLVDDEEQVREVTGQMLERLGLKVLQAVDGLDGLEKVVRQGDEIRCVLLDLTMPRLGGEATFREIQRRHPGLPVVLMSGYSEQQLTTKLAALGLAGFLQKPFSLETLAQKLQTALAQR